MGIQARRPGLGLYQGELSLERFGPAVDFDVSTLARHWAWLKIGILTLALSPLSPFAYPLHTYIPYSIEHTCAMAPHVTPLEKSDQLFVLAKQTTYFQDPWSSIPSSFWEQAHNLTGLEVASVATGDDELPKGIVSSGHVSRAEFEVMVSNSKLMLGIGRPLISPSVYSAL